MQVSLDETAWTGSIMDVLFLDFDGVLHPGKVRYEYGMRQPRLMVPRHELFESVAVFEAAIAPYPSIRIVLSTSWVQTLGFEETCAFLPETLQSRVIGATYDFESPDAWRWASMSRYDTIAVDVARRKPTRWLAIDNDAEGWPENQHSALALVESTRGLACPTSLALFACRLAARFP
jgi:Swiss Army Knife RNA repair-like protein